MKSIQNNYCHVTENVGSKVYQRALISECSFKYSKSSDVLCYCYEMRYELGRRTMNVNG